MLQTKSHYDFIELEVFSFIRSKYQAAGNPEFKRTHDHFTRLSTLISKPVCELYKFPVEITVKAL